MELLHGTGDEALESRSGEDDEDDEVPPEVGWKSLVPLRVERRLWVTLGRACVDDSRAPDRSDTDRSEPEACNKGRESMERRFGFAVSASGLGTGWAPGMEACLTDCSTDLRLGDEIVTCASGIVRAHATRTLSEPGADDDVRCDYRMDDQTASRMSTHGECDDTKIGDLKPAMSRMCNSAPGVSIHCARARKKATMICLLDGVPRKATSRQ